MKKIILLLSLTVLFVNGAFGEETVYPTTKKIPDQAYEVAKDSATFALQLYQELPSTSNICFSPYSISSAMAMAYNGARGDTQKEMSDVLHFSQSIEEVNLGWAWLNKFLTVYPSNASEDVRVRIANSLWMQSNFPVLPSFRDTMAKYFTNTFRFVDFKTQSETARATINAWVKQNTFGKISDILSSQSLNSTTRMVLISALYLKAKWQNQFDIHLTNQQPFFLMDGTLQTALSMTQSAYFPYLDTPEVSILEIPYIPSRKEGPEFSMLIILPHEKNGLAAVEQALTYETLDQWVQKLETTHVLATIPKFKILELTNLNEIMSKMGMNLPFSDDADFSGMSAVKGLKIGNIVHKVFLSVDETGSEAAAATAISMNTRTSLDPKQPVIFQADHPFLYMIFEKTTGTILFMGRLTDPHQMDM